MKFKGMKGDFIMMRKKMCGHPESSHASLIRLKVEGIQSEREEREK